MALFTKNVNPKTVENIHKNVLKVLTEKGIKFGSEKALEIFKKHGATVQDNVVFISEKMLMDALKTVPEQFVLKGRDEKYNVTIGGDNTVYCPAYGPVFVMRNNQQYSGKTEDVINFAKLTQSSKVINVMNPYTITPNDVEVDKLLLFLQATTLKYGTKPTMCITAAYDTCKKALQMVKKINAKKPDDIVAIGLTSPLSPLAYDKDMCEAIIAYAEEGQALVIGGGALPGATSPVSIMGSMISVTAEIMGGIVLAQLVSPGTPCVIANVTASTDMRYITPACGTAEAIKITALAQAVGEFYKIPTRGTAAVTDSKETDFEAGSEAALVLAGCIMSKANYLIHSCGIMDSFNSVGYEKYVLDEQNIEIIEFMLKEPNEDEEVLGLNAIFDVAHGAQYIEHTHTFEHMRSELYTPKISLRGYYDSWKINGAPSLLDLANKEVDRRLSEYQLDDLLNQEQKEYLEKYL